MEIARDIFNDLKAWKDSKRRKPSITKTYQGCSKCGTVCKTSWLRKTENSVMLTYKREREPGNMNLPSNGYALPE